MSTAPAQSIARSRILIVDDHPLVREALAGRIRQFEDIEVCGESDDVQDALDQVREKMPDLVIVDISLKTGNGIELIKQVHSQFPSVKMLVSSMYDEGLYADRVLRAGASGYISKQEAPGQVMVAVRRVLAGNVYLSRLMTDQLLSCSVSGTQESPIQRLSDRELEVFQWIGNGLTTRQIAEQLHLSVHTVETYREKIKSKLHLTSSAKLSQCAVQWVVENA